MTRKDLRPDHDSAGDADETRWTPVATAPDQLVAEMWQQLLREDSIPSMLAPQDAVSFLGISSTPVRLMVPLAMKTRAEELLAELRGGEALLPGD